MRSSTARRPWYARARALFSSVSELKSRPKPQPRTQLRVSALEDRVHPSITPLGEFNVSSSPSSSQKDPAIASDAAGNLVIVWHAPSPEGGEGIYGQRFDVTGARLGAEFRANLDVYSSYYAPAVAMAPDGRFVVAWHQWDKTDNGVNTWEVFARQYAADGTPEPDEIRVNAVSTGLQSNPAVAVAPDGSFVVAFVDQRDYVAPFMEVSARRFDANGDPVGQQLSVNQTPTYNQYQPSIGMDEMGNFVVGWTSEHQDGYANGVYARRYAADGTELSDEFRVNTTWSFDEYAWLGAVGMAANGDFAVVWQGGALYGDTNRDVYLQRYAADGTPIGGETLVNETSTTGRQENATVAVGPDGDLVVAWQSYAGEGSNWEIRAQQFSAEGTRIGDEIRVSEATGVADVSPRLTIDGNGYATTAFMRQNFAGGSLGPVAQRLGGYSTVAVDSGTTTIPTVEYGDSGPPVYESLTVTATVTAGAPGYEDLYLWRYHVRNNDYSEYVPEGVSVFEIGLDPGTLGDVTIVGNSLGWSCQTGYPIPPGAIRWYRTTGTPSLAAGQEADFGFTTPVMAIGFAAPSVEEMFTALGPLPGPGVSNATISFRNASDQPTQTLKVAKWEKSFDWGPINPNTSRRTPTLKQEFILPDDDRFYVYVTDPGAKKDPNVKDTVTVRVRSSSVAGNTVTLEETGVDTGEFKSPSLLLVSNDIDDLNERTLRVKLDDKVTATYTDAAGMKPPPAVASVPTTKIVKVHVIILNQSVGGNLEPVVTRGAALADIRQATKTYAQIGIRFVATFNTVNPPDGVDLSDGVSNTTAVQGVIDPTAEEKALLGAADLRTPATDDIELYYVNYLADSAKGMSFPKSAVTLPAYADSAIINSRDKRVFTVAHEIGHILSDDGAHFPQEFAEVNLMRGNGTSDTDTVTASKRLTATQGAVMLQARPNLLTSP